MASDAVTASLPTGARLDPQDIDAPMDPNFGLPTVNKTGVSNRELYDAMTDSDRQMIAAFSGWASSTQPTYKSRQGGLFQRDRYITPVTIRDQMRVAYAAVEQDDVVSSAARVTEALAFSDCSFVAEDEDDEDIYNQIAEELDLDARLREIWRELFTVSQCYIAIWWEDRVMKVRGKTDKGNEKRKSYVLRVPTNITLLDPLRVVPVGTTIFGKERLAYCANRSEHQEFLLAMQDVSGYGRFNEDEIVKRLVVEPYLPDAFEKRELQDAGFDVQNLWLLNPDNVFRHTATRPSFRRWAPVDMRSIFELLDQKQQLRQSERAHLLGATNFIVLVTKGSDMIPAKPDEIENLKVQTRTIGSMPVLVGDHRLKVDIVTPKMDLTLKAERWNTLDSRITANVYGMFSLGNYAAGAQGDDSAKLTKVVAKGMESRRKMIRRVLEKHVFKPMYDMNDDLKTKGKLLFHPASIALDFDASWAMFLLQLRQDREISRDTILTQFDLNQKHEFLMLTREKDKYDDTFQSQVAFSGPGAPKGPFIDPNTGQQVPAGTPGAIPAPAGTPAKKAAPDNGGGRRNGGGAAPGTGQGQPAKAPNRKSDKGRKAKVATAGTLTITITDDEGNVVAQGEPLPGIDATALLLEREEEEADV